MHAFFPSDHTHDLENRPSELIHLHLNRPRGTSKPKFNLTNRSSMYFGQDSKGQNFDNTLAKDASTRQLITVSISAWCVAYFWVSSRSEHLTSTHAMTASNEVGRSSSIITTLGKSVLLYGAHQSLLGFPQCIQ